MTAVRLKTLPWMIGVALLALSFVAANRLLHTQEGNNGAGGDAPKAQPKPNSGPAPHGLTVLGTVDCPGGIARVDAPALPAFGGATVAEVHVREGQEVKAGDWLLTFDDSAFRAKVDQAEAALLAAKWETDKAQKAKDELPTYIELQKFAVAKAESDLKYAQEAVTRGREQLEVAIASSPEVEKTNRRRFNLELLEGEHKVDNAKIALDAANKELKRIETKSVDAEINMTAAKIKGLTAAVAEAKAVVELTKVKARVGGIVERIAAQPGKTFGAATREPALYIVPAGTRIVRAEVDAESAHKIHDRVGKTVTIYDARQFNLTYEGRLTRIGTSYMPSRGSADTLTVNPTYMLECEIEVLDPAPAGKSPLRVGQKVRVAIGS